mgnify:CR=1 FL=1
MRFLLDKENKKLSPQVRGCAREPVVFRIKKRVFPAGAGVILSKSKILEALACFPRRCGGDPYVEELKKEYVGFSPQVRG